MPQGSQFVSIGYDDVESNKTHLGNNKWMPTKLFNAVMNNNKPSVFVKDLARYLFGTEILIKSTVTGKPSNRSKNKLENKNITNPEPLDPTLLTTLRGEFYIFLKNTFSTSINLKNTSH